MFVTTVYEMLFGGLVLLGVGTLSRASASPAAYETAHLGGAGLPGRLRLRRRVHAYVWLLANAPISLVATYAYVNPVVAVFLGWLVLAEAVTPAVLAGAASWCSRSRW